MIIASLIALLTCAASLILGFRRGLLRQIPMLIGVVTGIVCAHIFAVPAQKLLTDNFPSLLGRTESLYVISNLAAGSVFILTFAVFYLATIIISLAFRNRERSVFDGIWGALSGLFTALMLLSICFNFIVCMRPHNILMSSMRHSDGNIVHSVMMVAPSLLGAQTPEELSHLQQLDEAKAIS